MFVLLFTSVIYHSEPVAEGSCSGAHPPHSGVVALIVQVGSFLRFSFSREMPGEKRDLPGANSSPGDADKA